MEERFFDIQQQLFGGTQLLQISPSLFPLQYSKMAVKKLPVLANLDVNFRPGYLGEESVQITPDSVVVHGPQNTLDTLENINTEEFKALDVHQNIDQKIGLEELAGVEFEVESIELYWSVLPYSEKRLTIPIEVVNLPLGVKVKLFPPEVNLRATLPLSLLSAVKSSDFLLVVDYEDINEGQSDVMEIKLRKQPPSVKKVIWEPLNVNYLIRR
jgi:YbbR domain-containing protein